MPLTELTVPNPLPLFALRGYELISRQCGPTRPAGTCCEETTRVLTALGLLRLAFSRAHRDSQVIDFSYPFELVALAGLPSTRILTETS